MSQKIDASEIEAKLRRLQSEVDDTTAAAMPTAVGVGIAVVVGVTAVAFLVGQRSTKKRTTVVEVRRV